jgi:hypothetical protein
MQEWCTTTFERLEIHRVIVRRALRPIPRKAAEPFASQGAYGRLRRLTFVALLRTIALGSAGRPGGCRRPLHACVAQARRPLAAPVHPGLLAPACRDRRQARRCLACLGGGDAVSLCAAGAKEAGRTHGAGPWRGGQPRAVGMVLGAWRHRGLAGGNGRQRDAALGHERLPQEHSGGMTPSAGVSALALLIAWRRVSLPSPERTWGARQPPSRGERRVSCELRPGAYGGAWGAQGGERVAGFEEDRDLAFGLGGVSFGPARGKRCTGLSHGEQLDGQEHEAIRVAPCRPERPLRAVQAHRDRVSVAVRTESLAPGLPLGRTMGEAQQLPWGGARSLAADLVLRRSPAEATKGRKGGGCLWLQG